MIRYTRSKTDEELEQILALQHRNLSFSISKEELEKEGFVTVHHDFDLLKKMNDACAHIIAKDGQKVVGYTLCMHSKFGNEIEVLKSMFVELSKHTDRLQTDNFVVMGQVCIDKAYRRRGIFRKLYETMKAEVIPPFDAIITEVNAKNIRSKEAHKAVGFEVLAIHQAEGQTWELIYLQ